ncbi:MAG: hypothetical protein ACM34K_17125 [Bacillota bacterium]
MKGYVGKIYITKSPEAPSNGFVLKGMGDLWLSAYGTVKIIKKGDGGTIPPAAFKVAINTQISSGVEVLISPSDKDGFSGGLTNLIRKYDSGTAITITSPGRLSLRETKEFDKYLIDKVTVIRSNPTTVEIKKDTLIEIFYKEISTTPEEA